MSHTYEDLALDYEFERQEVEEEWERHLSEAVGLFAEGRLKSYYVAHPDVAQRATEALAYSKALLAQGHSRAALVFAGTAMEVGYKAVLLRPIVSGLVHTEGLAEVVMLLATEHTGLERFFELLAAVLAEFGSVDLKTFVRQGAKRRFWDEMKAISSARNDVVHKGTDATEETAAMAVAVAETLLDVLLPRILDNLGLKLQAGNVIQQ
jgi:hypothetical protein